MSTPDDAGAEPEEVEGNDSQGASPSPKSVGKSAEKANAAANPSKKKAKDDRQGIFARFAKFLRQVVAELRKVIWPTRSELINYASVVLVFVVIMAAILAAYDFAFARAVFFVFGG